MRLNSEEGNSGKEGWRKRVACPCPHAISLKGSFHRWWAVVTPAVPSKESQEKGRPGVCLPAALLYCL